MTWQGVVWNTWCSCADVTKESMNVRQHLVTDELSIGDYVLSGGELPAMVVAEAVVRLLPGVLGSAESAEDDSFSGGLLQFPQYTRRRNIAAGRSRRYCFLAIMKR